MVLLRLANSVPALVAGLARGSESKKSQMGQRIFNPCGVPSSKG